jgi:hypothetical protein
LALQNDFYPRGETGRNMLREPQGRGWIRISGNEQRRHRGYDGIAVVRRQLRLRPFAAGRLLFTYAILAEERVPCLRQNIAHAQERDNLAY